MGTPDRISELLDRWEDMRDVGREMSPEELCADSPELLPELRRRVEFLLKLEDGVTTRGVDSRTTVPAADFPVVPGYEILAELGRGGMGVVYRAIQQSLGRAVALKMVLGSPALNRAEVARLRVEATVIGRMHHPNVVQIYDVGEREGRPYFALELIEGGSLAHRLTAGPLDPLAAAALVAKLAQAVQAVHERGIIHRDIKPGNVLLEGDGTPKLTDFGLARLLDPTNRDPTVSRTETGAVIGTPAYMAPEQAAGLGRDAGPLADVYALRAVLFHCLTGRPPFTGVSVVELLHRVVNDTPTGPRSLRQNVPRDLDTVCLKCLEKDPLRRYASAATLAADLENVLLGRPVLARRVSTPERFWRWCRRRPWLAATGAVAILALLAAAGLGIGFALFAERKAKDIARLYGESEKNRLKAERTLTEVYLDRGLEMCHQGDPARGMWWLLRALEACPAGADDLQTAIRMNLGTWRDDVTALEYACSHPVGVAIPAVSPDGSLLVVGAHDGTLWFRNAATGEPVTTPVRHGARPVRALAFHPTQAELATGSDDGSLRLWNPRTQTTTGILREPQPGTVTALAYNHDGKYLAGLVGTEVVVWDMTSRTRTGSPIRHSTSGIVGLGFVPRSEILTTAGNDATIRFWDAPSWASRGAPVPAGGTIRFALDSAGQGLAVSSGGRRVAIYLLEKRVAVDQVLTQDGFPTTLAFDPDSTNPVARLLVGELGGTVRMWALRQTRPTLVTTVYEGSLTSASFTPTGSHLLTAAGDGSVRRWRLGVSPDQARVAGSDSIGLATISPDGRTAAIARHDGSGKLSSTVQIIETVTMKPRGGAVSVTGIVTGLQFDHAGTTLAVAAQQDTSVRLVDPNSGQLRGTLAGSEPTRDLRYASDGLLVTLCATPTGGTLRLLDPQAQIPPGPIITFPDRPWELRLNRDGSRALVLPLAWEHEEQRGRVVPLWNPRSGERIAELAHEQTITGAAFSPDGTRIVTGARDGTVRVWHGVTGQALAELGRHAKGVTGVAFSEDGSLFATSSNDGTARIWSASDGSLYRSLSHGNWVTWVSFSPDGHLVTTAGDAQVRVWDLATGRSVGPPWLHFSDLSFTSFSQGGSAVLTTSYDGIARSFRRPTSWDDSLPAIRQWLLARTGVELDGGGSLRVLPVSEWNEAASRVARP